MGTVVANMSMSLDGCIEDGSGSVGPLFGWVGSGQQATVVPGDEREFRTSQASADHLREAFAATGALVCGRRLFDLTHGWSGRHPVGAPVFVVMHEPPEDWAHPDAPFTFVTDGVASAVEQAQAAAGGRGVAVASADVARQCLDLGLLDAIAVDVVPVLLGGGTPWFAGLQQAPVVLGTPTVVEGDGVRTCTSRSAVDEQPGGQDAVPAPGPRTDLEFAERAERHRRELHVHCYRMLGNVDDAEDAVQDTLLRAWRRHGDLQRGANLRAWLYKIATNVCLDRIKASGRRVPSLSSFRDVPWLEPYPDRLLDQAAAADQEPHTALVGRETIALTFLAVLQLLPPRQRAALVLRDVLAWPPGEIAQVLELTTAAVNSALQRARATLREQLPVAQREQWTPSASSQAERDVLDRYVSAYELGDTAATLALITDDIRVTMPPAPYLFQGRAAILELADRARSTGNWRLVPTRANRQPAAACYLQEAGEAEFRAFKIDVLRVVDGAIAEITTFGAKHFPAFDLPAVLP